ncbi:FtsX-like permease family protein [Kitasatospora acidiphila]|uniref:FtsX-like permease family protein n=1 Tax=Kitasatospora acidiphila TaxID=2567942 RepID=A0A540W2E7_9ACTN|nr:FtsX-like permease family protein [Kitasatospora acidiphila]TQF03162.1 FtsX-like permease family protein [Kitasatospora acidiphila]
MGGFVLRRLRSRLALAGAAMLTVLLTATTLAALNAFEAGVGDAGLHRALTVQDRNRATVDVTADGSADQRGKTEQQVRQLAGDLFSPLPTAVQRLARSHPFALPSPVPVPRNPDGSPADPDLTFLASLDPARVTVTAGRLPKDTAPGAPIEVAVPDVVVARLGLHTDALPAPLHLVDRYDGSSHDVLITGTYHPTDTTDRYWQLDELGGHGLSVSGFTTYGPLLVPDSAFTGSALTQQSANWQITADFSSARAAALDALRTRVPQVVGAFQNSTGYTATTRLPAALGDLHNDLLVARSTLVIGGLQLVVLAVAALLLVTRLLSERQATENALLTARGAARRRIAGITALEAGLLALPGGLLGPLLLPPVLGLIGRFGPLARTGVRLGNGLAPSSWLVTMATAVGAVLIVLVPNVLRAGGAVLQRRSGRRQAAASGLLRSGADVALLVLAGLAYLQLDHYSSGVAGGGALSTDASGQLGLDPVLVVAPTLALCAGTMLTLRLLPLAARLGERWAVRGRGLPAALSGWQFARRPRRNAGPVLLMVLAVSMGMLALGQAATLSASQRDQADFSSVGGLRISGLGLTSLGQAGLLSGLPGGDRVIPVSRQALPLNGGQTGQLLAIDTRQASNSVRLRDDLTGGRTPAQLYGPLADQVPSTSDGLALPGKPLRVSVDLSMTTAVTPEAVSLLPGAPLNPPVAPTLQLVMHDRFGLVFTVPLGTNLPLNGDATVTADLGAVFAHPAGAPAYPLTLIGVQAEYYASLEGQVNQQLTIHQITAAPGDGTPGQPVGHPDHLGWQLDDHRSKDHPADLAQIATVNPQDLLAMTFSTGQGTESQDATVTLPNPTGANLPATIPALATKDFLAAAGAKPGDEIPMQIGVDQLRFKIIGVVPALPTTGSPSGGPSSALLADLHTIDRVIATQSDNPLSPTEWWLPSRGPGDPQPAAMAAALRSSAASGQLQLDGDLVTGMRADPLTAAPQTGLLALTIAAAALAAIGFTAAAIGAAAERAVEFAVLRALGSPHRQLARTAAAEQGILIGLGLGLGALLGTVLVHLVVPLTVLTPTAGRPVPAAMVALPIGQVLVLLAAVAALPVLLTVHRVLRPARAAETTTRLRHSEEM